MRKSRTDTAETRERILTTASYLFLERGLAATGMRELMTAANLTQGGFYRHFTSREQLVAEAIAAAFDRVLTRLADAVVARPPSSSTAAPGSLCALETIISLYLGQPAPGTPSTPAATSPANVNRVNAARSKANRPALCPLAQLGVELTHCGPEVRVVARNGHRRLVTLIAAHLPPGGTASANRATASAIISTLAGAVMLAGLTQRRTASRDVLADARAAALTLARNHPTPTQPRRPPKPISH